MTRTPPRSRSSSVGSAGPAVPPAPAAHEVLLAHIDRHALPAFYAAELEAAHPAMQSSLASWVAAGGCQLVTTRRYCFDLCGR